MSKRRHHEETAKRIRSAKSKSRSSVRTPFSLALSEAIRSHGDTSKSLLSKLKLDAGLQQRRALAERRTGRSTPLHRKSRLLLGKIEQHYGLPGGYFAKLITQSRPSFKGRWRELNAFQFALNSLMAQFGDSSESLANEISEDGCYVGPRSLTYWKVGTGLPRNSSNNRTILKRIEKHYRLDEGFLTNLIKAPDTPSRLALKSVPVSFRTIMRWHLPADFDRRSEGDASLWPIFPARKGRTSGRNIEQCLAKAIADGRS